MKTIHEVEDKDEYCTYCGDDTLIAVIGKKEENGYYGYQVNLCSVCFAILRKEMKHFDNFF